MSVYAIQAGVGGPIKIGVASNVKKRLIEIQVANADGCRLLGIKDGNVKAEKDLHSRLASHRIRGEWFAPHAEVLAAIAVEFSPPPRIKAKVHSGERSQARLAAVRDAKMKRTADFAAIPGVADALRERRRRGVLRSKITDIEKQIALLEGRVWGRDEQPDAALASRNSGSIKLATQKLEAKKAAFAALPPIAIDVDGMRASFNGATHLQHGGPVARTGAAG